MLRGGDGRFGGIDHGLCHTVSCNFAGKPIPKSKLADIAPLAEAVPAELADLLDDEVTALQRRAQRMLVAGSPPVDCTGMRYTWPLV